MGQVKSRKLKLRNQKESPITRALKGLQSGLYTSIRKAAEINSIAYTTLRRRFHGGQGRVARQERQHLVIAAEERAIVHWIYRLELAGFPPCGRTRKYLLCASSVPHQTPQPDLTFNTTNSPTPHLKITGHKVITRIVLFNRRKLKVKTSSSRRSWMFM
ncbi:hypothetical protein EV426DRAFT_616369 [Tirmania nivea]|nr:hypothetical protein EV426DRAFT_616369 [Tirmania nivea]